MWSKDKLLEQVTDAYNHLYDLVYLRTHPLLDLLPSAPDTPRKEKAWDLHHRLLDVIDELNPNNQAPVFSREWRRHRLMVLRYVDGMEPQVVADELSISRRHFYREHSAAVEAISELLWHRFTRTHPQETASAPPGEPAMVDRLALLRSEVARLNQAGRYTRLGDVLQGCMQLVQEMARQKQIALHCEPIGSATVGVDRHILRQLLLGLLSYLVEQMVAGEIQIKLTQAQEEVLLHLRLGAGDLAAGLETALVTDVQLSTLAELARLQEAAIEPVVAPNCFGFDLHLPAVPPRTVLVVDDNEDVLHLFTRYLDQHHYRIITTQNSAEALQLARALQPYAVVLDLMLPEQDGWDVLQTLVNQPETQHIPVVISTVLRAKQLALSLGATAFLEKPVSEGVLLSTLDALDSD